MVGESTAVCFTRSGFRPVCRVPRTLVGMRGHPLVQATRCGGLIIRAFCDTGHIRRFRVNPRLRAVKQMSLT
jgi:hypothetical protein